MSRLLTDQEIRESLKQEGYILLSVEGKGSLATLTYLCPNNHHGKVKWRDWKYSKVRCKECKFLEKEQAIKEALDTEGYQIEKIHMGKGQTQIRATCPQKHSCEFTLSSWNQGIRCRKCSNEKQKISFEEVKRNFERKGYTLLENEYVNRHSKMRVLCSRGHELFLTWDYWIRGLHRCKQCEGLKSSLEEIRQLFAKEGYQVIDSEYINTHTPIRFRCAQGHLGTISRTNWLNGGRCLQCSREGKRYDIEYMKEQFEKENYQLLSAEWTNKKLEVECPQGHSYFSTWTNWQQGYRCPHCSKSISKAEQEIFDHYSFLKPERTRKIISPLELDIYFEKQKIAIEYCGLYWHSTFHKRITSNYHYKKMKACNDKGIRLITIFEDEWLKNKDLCISRINAALGISQTRIYARKCYLQKISFDEARDFLTSYHLQGSSGREIAFGLFHENILVSVMTLGKPSRAHVSKNVRTLELKRFASLPNIIVVGGASRLFKAAKNYAKQEKYKRIVSYCDLRWGTGKVYSKLGMTLIRTSKYTPHYTDFVKRWRNQRFAGNKQESEKEKVEKAKAYRIYDCGHQAWEFSLA